MTQHKSLLMTWALLLFTSAANAQLLFDPMTVHPERIQPDQPFLILLDDSWIDSCGGTLSLQASNTEINVIATLSSPMLGGVCAQVLTPFRELINPLAELDTLPDFEDSIVINYLVDNGFGAMPRDSETITFTSAANTPVRLQSGSWVTPGLTFSGLFIDQQDDIFTAALMDFSDDGDPLWHYGGGRLNGNTFIGEMASYHEIVCVTQPCDRAAPDNVGTVYVLVDEFDSLLVEYNGILGSTLPIVGGPMQYSRLPLTRSASIPAEDPALPDLVGNWVAGSSGDSSTADNFTAVMIDYTGPASQGLSGHYFDVFDQPVSPGLPVLLYRILCQDARPVDGTVACSLEGYRFDGLDCSVAFAYTAVGDQRLTAAMTCGNGTRSVDGEYRLFRMD